MQNNDQAMEQLGGSAWIAVDWTANPAMNGWVALPVDEPTSEFNIDTAYIEPEW